MGLKYRFPMLAFLVAFGAVVYLSFRHEPRRLHAEDTSATQQETQDQLSLSASHPEPAAAANPGAPGGGHEGSPGMVINASAADLAKLQILDEILAAHNDNDPRMDTLLKGLSPAAKSLIQNRYAATAAEKRNQRGTMVFLVGRELSSAADVGFLHSVLNEPPCLSLSNCAKEEQGSMLPSEHHHDGENEVTLAYPQLVALEAIKSYLERPGDGGELSPSLLTELEAARRSPVRKVASLADEISREYHARHP